MTGVVGWENLENVGRHKLRGKSLDWMGCYVQSSDPLAAVAPWASTSHCRTGVWLTWENMGSVGEEECKKHIMYVTQKDPQSPMNVDVWTDKLH